MEKLSQLLNASLASRMILVGYDYDIFGAMNDLRVSMKINRDKDISNLQDVFPKKILFKL